MSGRPKSSSSSSQYVELSRWGYALWWSIILVVHLLTGGYNAAFAIFYTELQHTYLYQCLEYSRIGMLAKDHHVIVKVNAGMAALHGVCILQMIGGSIRHRELTYTWSKSKTRTGRLHSSDKASKLENGTQPRSRFTRLYSTVLGRRGLLGVNGSSFHALLLGRELVETGLQTMQGYRMSWLLPRMLLNRFFSSLIVMNCWSSVLVYSLLFRRNEARKRFAYLVCDCTLNLVSCIGVPLIVLFGYVGEYDSDLTGFALEKWYDDEWSARVLNEFQIILVVSWMDLASRTVFSFGIITTTNSLKALLRRSAGATSSRIACDTQVFEIPNNDVNTDTVPNEDSTKVAAHKPPTSTNWRTRAHHRILNIIYALFAVWGLIIIALHIQSSMQPALPQCALQVHPWAVSNPACYLAVLDCHHLGLSGEREEVKSKWDEFDRSTVVTLVIRHCSELEVPDTIGDFHITTGIKVYNTTIADWGESAAVTNKNHPELIWFYLVRVVVPNGRLPAGLLSADFPHNLYDLEFTYTNIRELPDDLDEKWFIGTTVYFEYSELTSVPMSLIRLEPYSISLTGSPITELPAELFEVAELAYMFMGGIRIHELPRNVVNLSPQLVFVVFDATNISFFWPWIDSLVENHVQLYIGGSTYCADLQNILSGEAETFSVVPSSEYSAILMDSSETNRDVLSDAVNCDTQYAVTVYPINFEDSISALV